MAPSPLRSTNRPPCCCRIGSISSWRSCFEAGEGAGLVRFHETRVADNVRGQDGRQPALDPCRRHVRPRCVGRRYHRPTDSARFQRGYSSSTAGQLPSPLAMLPDTVLRPGLLHVEVVLDVELAVDDPLALAGAHLPAISFTASFAKDRNWSSWIAVSAGIAAFAFGPILPRAMIAALRTTGLGSSSAAHQSRHGLGRASGRTGPASSPRARSLERAAPRQVGRKPRDRDIQGQRRDDQAVDQAIGCVLARRVTIGRPGDS